MKNLKYIIIGIVLIGLSILIAKKVMNSDNSTIKSNSSDFGISDTAAITKLFIADMKGNSVLLERNEDNTWILNGEFDVVHSNVNTTLETIKLMTVKSPVAKARYDKTIRDLASVGVKVEVYMGKDTPSKVFYVGTPNQNHTGSYMMLEGSELPYLVHIEGFYGFLSPRFSVHESDWKRKTIFNINPKDIAEVRLSFPSNVDAGFTIKQDENSHVSLFNHAGIPVNGWDTGYIFEYLDRYREINFEMWEETKTPIFIDSVSTSTPLEIYELVDRDGNITTVKTLLKPLKSGMDIDGNPIDHDQDRMYALINDKEFVIIQYFVFDPLNHDIKYFYSE